MPKRDFSATDRDSPSTRAPRRGAAPVLAELFGDARPPLLAGRPFG